MHTQPKTYLYFLLFTILCFGVFSNNYQHDFNLDSGHVALENPYIRSLSYIPQYFVDPGTFSSLRANVDYRPVLQVTYALNYWMGGYDTFWWHFTQILLHLICVIGLYIFSTLVLRKLYPDSESPIVKYVPLIAAIIFAIHPTTSGVINYFSARSSLLTAAFLFPCLILYIKSNSNNKNVKYWDASALYMFALFTKIEAVAVLAPLFFIEILIQTAGDRKSFFHDVKQTINITTLKRLSPFFAVTIFYFAVRWIFMRDYDFAASRHSADVGSYEYLITQFTAWWHYILNWFAPVNLIADDLSFPVFYSITEPKVLLALSGWIILFGCLIYYWKTKPYLLFFALTGLALISPTSSIAPLAEMVNEHRPYMPIAVASLVWLIPITEQFFQNFNRKIYFKYLFIFAFSLAIFSLGRMTYQRNIVFKSERSYWKDVVDKAPSSRSYVNYGLTFMSKGDFDNAYELFSSSLELAPYWHIPNINMGIVYEHFDNDSMAFHYYNEAVKYEQYSAHALEYRGNLYLKDKDYSSALNDFTEAVPLNTYLYEPFKGMATSYAGLGDYDGCLEFTLKCMKLDSIQTMDDIVPISTPFWDYPNLYQSGINYYLKLDKVVKEQWWIHYNISELANLVGDSSLYQKSFSKMENLKPIED